MNDNFEDSLRAKLSRAVPDPPDEPKRAEQARSRAARARRTRVSAVAAGAAAVVVAAIAIVPTIVGAGDSANQAGPASEPTQAGTASDLNDPYTCPTSNTVSAAPAPKDGVIAEGAVLARICPVGEVPWSPPADALTTNVDDVARSLNHLPLAKAGQVCTMELGPAYTLTFQYPDGSVVGVQGENYGCQQVMVGDVRRTGATRLMDTYFDRLLAQRASSKPPADLHVTLRCPEHFVSGEGAAPTLLPLGKNVGLHRAVVCSYPSDPVHGKARSGELSPDQLDVVNADIAARAHVSAKGTGSGVQCLGPGPSMLVLGVNAWGDRIALLGSCDKYMAGDLVWTPAAQTARMLSSVLE